MPTGTIKMNQPPPQPIIGPPPKSTKYKGVKHTIMVMSGKGGVGKSTISVNLAVSLARNYRVGLIDADINGPDDPKMLGVSDEKVDVNEEGKILPVKTKYNVDVISMGFLLPTEDTAVIWRGALRHKALQQFLEDVAWGERDFVIMDMPSTLYFVFTGRILPSSLTSTFSSETPSIFGSSGPFISASMSPTL